MRRSIARRVLAGALTVGLIGCNTGKHDPPPSGGGGATPPPTPTGPPTGAAMEYSRVPHLPGQQSETIGAASAVLALIFTLDAQNDDVLLHGITLASAGTLLNGNFTQAMLIADDTPANGALDAAEFAAPLASVPPGMSANPDRFTIGLAAPQTVTPGAARTFFVVLDPGAVAAGDTTVVGDTVEVGLADAADLDVRDTANNAIVATAATGTTIGPAPYPASRVTVGVHPHLLISEVVNSPTGAEFVEVYNPTGATVSLTNYYVTDFLDPNAQAATPSIAFYNLPTGDHFDPSQVSTTIANNDFLVRFPAAAQIAPGQVIVVAVDGAGFATAYGGQNPDYYLTNAGAGGAQMLTWDGATTATTPPTPPGFAAGDDATTLANAAEGVLLFVWDQASDLIQDVDLVNYGQNPSGANFGGIDKTGVSVDGPDGATTATQFQADTSSLDQSTPANRTADGDAIARTDYTEGAETKLNGNGLLGHDETSEDFNNTFVDAAAATPGTIP